MQNRRQIIRGALAGMSIRTPRQMKREEKPLPIPRTLWQWECETRWARSQELDELHTELGGEG